MGTYGGEILGSGRKALRVHDKRLVNSGLLPTGEQKRSEIPPTDIRQHVPYFLEMGMQRYSIRLERSHSEAFELWWESMRDLRWNRWSDDLATYLKASRTNAILLGDLDGTTIGHVLAAIYGNKTGWVGLFVVKSQYRGRFFGRSLLDAAIDQFRIHGTAYVGLDSVAEQKSSYERRGFVASPLGTIRCMSYKLSPSSSLVTISGLDSNLPELHLVDLREIPCEILSQSDYDHTGFERSDLWGIGIQNRADFFGLALAEKGKAFDKESVHGWVAVRRASEGYRLGPVYAADAAASRTLVRAAIQAVAVRASACVEPNGMSCSDVYIAAEVWGGNPYAVGIFEELG